MHFVSENIKLPKLSKMENAKKRTPGQSEADKRRRSSGEYGKSDEKDERGRRRTGKT